MSDLQLHVLKWQKMTPDLQLGVIQRMYKNVTEVHGENNEKFRYCKKCISGENKSIKNKSLKGLLTEVRVLCPGKFKNSCEGGSPCISMFDFFV